MRRFLVGAAIMAMVGVSCGQYPNVHERALAQAARAAAQSAYAQVIAAGGSKEQAQNAADTAAAAAGTTTTGVGTTGTGTTGTGTGTTGTGTTGTGTGTTGTGTGTTGTGTTNPSGGGNNTGGGSNNGGGNNTGGGGNNGGGNNTGGGGNNGGGNNTGGGGNNGGGNNGGGNNGGGNNGGGNNNNNGGGGGSCSNCWGDTITIGLHVPITGAAPLTLSSFESQKDLYWKYGDNGKPFTVYGRKVEVVVEDDQYNPSHAREVCQKMVQQDNAFLLVGGAGSDQIVACAQYAQQVDVPYLSAGVTQDALAQFPNYYAVSETYPQQAGQLAQYIKKTFTNDCSQVDMIVEDTPNFDDAISAFENACQGVNVQRVGKNDSGQSYGSQLCLGTQPKYAAVYVLHAPTFFLDVAASSNTCHPQFVGVGISMGIDIVADQYCKRQGLTGRLHFFSPAAAFANVAQYDRRFLVAADKAGVQPDDLGWLVWGLNRSVHALLLHAGKNLTRDGFVQSSASADAVASGYTDLHYSSSNHFGANQVNLLENVCQGSTGHYVTKKADAGSF